MGEILIEGGVSSASFRRQASGIRSGRFFLIATAVFIDSAVYLLPGRILRELNERRNARVPLGRIAPHIFDFSIIAN